MVNTEDLSGGIINDTDKEYKPKTKNQPGNEVFSYLDEFTGNPGIGNSLPRVLKIFETLGKNSRDYPG